MARTARARGNPAASPYSTQRRRSWRQGIDLRDGSAPDPPPRWEPVGLAAPAPSTGSTRTVEETAALARLRNVAAAVSRVIDGRRES
jgi:hypothetical protein